MIKTKKATIEWHQVDARPHTVTDDDLEEGLYSWADKGERVFLVYDCPDEPGEYLITLKTRTGRYIATDNFDADECMFEQFDWDEIVAWAEFPEPFKEK